MELIEILQSQWAIRALIASSMVGIMCGVLGCFIVLRNMSLIGDALSHAILPGVVFGFMIAGYSVLGFFVGSVIAGLIAAFAITWIQQNVKTKNDAAIGIVFTAMFSVGVMAISHLSRTEGVHLDLKDFLFGNVLGVSNDDLYLTAGIGIYVLISIVVFYRYLFATTFQPVIAETMGISVKTVHYFLMLLLSFVVVASLRTVGVILVVAMLITPAATALLLTNRLQRVLVYAGFIGFFSAASGLILAIIWDTTPGPAMTVVATIIYILAMLFSPEKGLVFKYFRNRKMKEKILFEDILKQTLRLGENGTVTVEKLSDKLGFSAKAIRGKLPNLKEMAC
ncbi:MAG: metal ABC transporter permease [Saprospiraceae bacterium]|nr:metal ABC transporter permease [Saprospiraceae bacterium]